jgi:sporulation protein YhbH
MMVKRIDRDKSRFRQIIHGKIKKDLRKYITRGELIGKKGKDFVSIPIPHINIPRFRFSPKKAGGVGQGEGQVGTPLGRGDEQVPGNAGDAPGEHLVEVDVALDELAQILGEELELPNIEAKGKKNISADKDRYTGISDTGPESLRHFKRTYKQALKRQIVTQNYDPDDPMIIPIREDKRYRTWKVTQEPESNAVIIYMMDVSGSMGDEQKEIVRIESFWLDTWLNYQYKNLETRYIIHDAVAREVDRETFYHTRESGGTIISSAYKLADKLIADTYNPSDWNIYIFHFSDGDNWGEIDTDECLALLKEILLPRVNLFCYGQVESPYGSGQFIRDLEDNLKDEEKIVLSEIPDKEGIYDSIKVFLGKGR